MIKSLAFAPTLDGILILLHRYIYQKRRRVSHLHSFLCYFFTLKWKFPKNTHKTMIMNRYIWKWRKSIFLHFEIYGHLKFKSSNKNYELIRYPSLRHTPPSPKTHPIRPIHFRGNVYTQLFVLSDLSCRKI